jgi:hypothetical protein
MVLVQWCFAHRLHDADAWRSLNTQQLTRWSSVRYLLEDALCKVKEKSRVSSGPKQQPARSTAYIEAYFYRSADEDWLEHPVPGNWYFVEGEEARLVIVRRAMPLGFRQHVPCELQESVLAALEQERQHNARHTQRHEDEFELEKDEVRRIHMICAFEAALIDEGAALSRARRDQQRSVVGLHPVDFEFEERVAADCGSSASARILRWEPVPPEFFVCPACGEQGVHFRAYCPLVLGQQQHNQTSQANQELPAGDEGFQEQAAPLDRLAVLKGVPAAFRQIVSPGNSKNITAEGDAVVLIKRNIVLREDLPVYMMLIRSRDASTAETIRPYEEQLPPIAVREPTGAQFDFEPCLDALDARLRQLEQLYYRDHPQLQRKGPVCLYFLDGRCHKGYLACEFSHDLGAKRPVCAFFAENKCKAGESCMFVHPKQITDSMIRPDKTNGLAPSRAKNEAARTAALEKRKMQQQPFATAAASASTPTTATPTTATTHTTHTTLTTAATPEGGLSKKQKR